MSDGLHTYADLLVHGVAFSPPGADVEAWRRELRAQARADKVRLRTGVVNGSGWAYNVDRGERIQAAYAAWSDATTEAERETASETLHDLNCDTPPEVMARLGVYLREQGL